MSWTEIVIEIARDNAEAMSDALMEAGALSVSVEDADEGTDAEQPLFGEPGMEPKEAAWERSRVVALTDVDADQAAIVAAAAQAVGMTEVPAFTMRPVEEQDWVRLTQSQFAPIHIGKNIWVVPSWHEAPDPDGLILELDPGLAFGTGSHPTTRLCMEWLEAQSRARQDRARLRLRLRHPGHGGQETGRANGGRRRHRPAGDRIGARQCRTQPVRHRIFLARHVCHLGTRHGQV